MKFKVLLWDIDGTLLNFTKAEKTAIKNSFKKFNLGNINDEMINSYSKINNFYWKKLEENKCTKNEVFVNRFIDFFKLYNVPIDDRFSFIEFNDCYQFFLANTIEFNDDSLKIIKKLKDIGYKQYAITNGTKKVQERKLKLSGIQEILDGIFISDSIGYEKPDINFFHYVLKKIDNYKKSEILIIGDSLSSDIKGANNIGIQSCWYNKNNELNNLNIKSDYKICSLKDIFKILEG